MPAPIKNVISMKLSAMEIPNTSYLINKKYGTNEFSIKIDDITHIIKIPDSNLTIQQLVDYLNESPGILKKYGIQLNYSEATGKVRFYHTGGKLFNIDFTNYDDKTCYTMKNKFSLNLGYLLGYRELTYKGNNALVSVALWDLTSNKHILLVDNDFQKNRENFYINGTLPENNISDTNILARISVSNTKFTIGFDDGSDKVNKERIYNGPITLDRLEFKLLNEYGMEIDLNNMDYSFALELKCLYG